MMRMFFKSVLHGLPTLIGLLGFWAGGIWLLPDVKLSDPVVWIMLFFFVVFSLLMGNWDADPGDCAGY